MPRPTDQENSILQFPREEGKTHHAELKENTKVSHRQREVREKERVGERDRLRDRERERGKQEW